MKLQYTLRAAIVWGALFVASAHATEYVNVPASIATPASTEPNNDCYVEVGVGFAATTDLGFCQVDFPLTVPVGHTIKQIAVVHGDLNFFGDPYINAYLMLSETESPYDTGSQFSWESHVPLTFPALQTSKLMAQSYKNFPDAFVVQSGVIYHVIVHLERGTTVEGIQVTYE